MCARAHARVFILVVPLKRLMCDVMMKDVRAGEEEELVRRSCVLAVERGMFGQALGRDVC